MKIFLDIAGVGANRSVYRVYLQDGFMAGPASRQYLEGLLDHMPPKEDINLDDVETIIEQIMIKDEPLGKFLHLKFEKRFGQNFRKAVAEPNKLSDPIRVNNYMSTLGDSLGEDYSNFYTAVPHMRSQWKFLMANNSYSVKKLDPGMFSRWFPGDAKGKGDLWQLNIFPAPTIGTTNLYVRSADTNMRLVVNHKTYSISETKAAEHTKNNIYWVVDKMRKEGAPADWKPSVKFKKGKRKNPAETEISLDSSNELDMRFLEIFRAESVEAFRPERQREIDYNNFGRFPFEGDSSPEL